MVEDGHRTPSSDDQSRSAPKTKQPSSTELRDDLAHRNFKDFYVLIKHVRGGVAG
jgi:hypothetical protein